MVTTSEYWLLYVLGQQVLENKTHRRSQNHMQCIIADSYDVLMVCRSSLNLWVSQFPCYDGFWGLSQHIS